MESILLLIKGCFWLKKTCFSPHLPFQQLCVQSFLFGETSKTIKIYLYISPRRNCTSNAYILIQQKVMQNPQLLIIWIHTNLIPGDSWSLIICLSVNCDLLWTSANEWLVLQFVHSVGSAIRPLSISTDAVLPHT